MQFELQKDRFKRAIEKKYTKKKSEKEVQEGFVERIERWFEESSAGDSSTNKIALAGALGYLAVLVALAIGAVFLILMYGGELEVQANQKGDSIAVMSNDSSAFVMRSANTATNSTTSFRARARCLGNQICRANQLHHLYDESSHATASAINSTMSKFGDLYDESTHATASAINSTMSGLVKVRGLFQGFGGLMTVEQSDTDNSAVSAKAVATRGAAQDLATRAVVPPAPGQGRVQQGRVHSVSSLFSKNKNKGKRLLHKKQARLALSSSLGGGEITAERISGGTNTTSTDSLTSTESLTSAESLASVESLTSTDSLRGAGSENEEENPNPAAPS
jgi:hypothetical protein